ncbi:MAG: TSUP family transporter, partial [Thermoleophilaceae bacterium]
GLIMLFRLVPQRVVGTDVLHAAILLWAAALAHIVAGNVDFALAGNILAGSIPGVWAGSHLAVRIPVATLRTILAVVLIGSGVGLLTKAGLDVPPAVLGAFPVAVALVLGSVALRARHAESSDAVRRAPPPLPSRS